MKEWSRKKEGEIKRRKQRKRGRVKKIKCLIKMKKYK